MEKKIRVGIVVAKTLADSLFAPEDLAYLQTFADINPVDALPEAITPDFMRDTLQGADAAITSWRTTAFTEEMLAALPDLRLVAHAAGAVRNLVPKGFWQSGRRITSNAPIIAEDVAQTTLALILTSLKQFWQQHALTATGEWKGGESGVFQTRRLDGLNVGLVGASLVGKATARLLAPFRCNLLMADPYLSKLEAERMGVRLMPLDEMIPLCDVLSLHAPANPDCRHMLNAANIPTMKDGCLLVNTARGMLVDEAALVRELRTGRIAACLDVTDPEPPATDHPFRTMENVVLLPHMAGGHTVNGRRMMGQNVIIEVYNFFAKGLLQYDIREEMLPHMA